MIGSAAILLLILLPIILSIVISLPAVQNRIVDRAGSFASDYLGTEVSIGRVDVSMRGDLQIFDPYARLQRDTMIYVARVESGIERLPIFGRRVGWQLYVSGAGEPNR